MDHADDQYSVRLVTHIGHWEKIPVMLDSLSVERSEHVWFAGTGRGNWCQENGLIFFHKQKAEKPVQRVWHNPEQVAHSITPPPHTKKKHPN